MFAVVGPLPGISRLSIFKRFVPQPTALCRQILSASFSKRLSSMMPGQRNRIGSWDFMHLQQHVESACTHRGAAPASSKGIAHSRSSPMRTALRCKDATTRASPSGAALNHGSSHPLFHHRGLFDGPYQSDRGSNDRADSGLSCRFVALGPAPTHSQPLASCRRSRSQCLAGLFWPFTPPRLYSPPFRPLPA